MKHYLSSDPRPRYLSAEPELRFSDGVRLVHNFYPGHSGNPGKDRALGSDGFRAWLTDEPSLVDRRCYCGWLDGREHYGTLYVIDAADAAKNTS